MVSFGYGSSGIARGATATMGKNVSSTNAQDDWNFNGVTDRSLRLWDVQTGKLLRKWESATGICSAQFAPDGRKIAVGTHGEALLFDAAT